MTSTEVPMPEAEKQHLGMVDVHLDMQQPCPPSQGYPVQPGYPPQQNNVPSEAPPSYSQTTNHIQPHQSQSTVVRTAPRSTTAFAGRPRPHVPDFTRLSWIVMLCCCLPFGMVAYFTATKAKDKHLYGDDEGAHTCACCSLSWSLAGIVCGVILSTLLFLYYYSGGY